MLDKDTKKFNLLSSSPMEDAGAQTFRKYNYQAAYGVILLTSAALNELPYELIICEYHEDYLAKKTDGKFDAYQVKTRTRENGKWDLSSKNLIKAVSRFVYLESKYSEQISNYIFVSNTSVLETDSKTEGPKSIINLIKEVVNSKDQSKLTSTAKKALTKLQTAISEELHQHLWQVLLKLQFIKSIPEENFYPELSLDHVGRLPWCKLQFDKIREVSTQLVSWVKDVSSDLIVNPEIHFPRNNSTAATTESSRRTITVADFCSRSKQIAKQINEGFPASKEQFSEATVGCNSQTYPNSSLIADLSDAQDSLIDEAVVFMRKGYYKEAHSRLQSIRTSSSWDNLLSSIKVRTLRLLATIAIQSRKDIIGAKKLLSEASTEVGNHRLNLEKALVLIAEGNTTDAANLLLNPATQQEFHLAAALILYSQGSIAAADYLNSSSFEQNPETLRLLAICAISERDYPLGLRMIDRSIEQASDWYLIRETAGAIYFLGAIPIEWEPWSIREWPVIPPKEFLLDTADACESIAKAQQTFEELSKDLTESGNSSVRIDTWYIASLAIDSSHHELASKLARKLLEEHPTCTQALIWALEFSLDVELVPIIKALHLRLDNTSETLEYRDALVHIACIKEDWQTALDLISNYRKLYEDQSRGEAWLLYSTQLLASLGQYDQCEDLIKGVESDEEQLRLRCAIARIKAKGKGWTIKLAKIPYDLYCITRKAHDLAGAVEASYFAQDYDFVVEKIEELLQKLPTPYYLRLGLEAAQRKSNYSATLKMLGNAPQIFGTTLIPQEIRQLEIDCLLKNGEYLEAEVSAKQLTKSINDRGVWLQLFHVQFHSGDSSGAQSTAKVILEREDAKSDELIHLADKIRADNPELARNLLRKANKLGLNKGQAAATAAWMTFSLGLESELSSVVKKVLTNPEESAGAIKSMSMQDTIELIQSKRSGTQKLEEAYDRGDAPLHLILERFNTPLYLLMSQQFSQQQTSAIEKKYYGGLYLFNGRNRDHIKQDLLDRSFSVLIDPTSLLLLEHLSLLDTIEDLHSPIYLPPSIFQWFANELAEISGFQKSRQNSLNQISRLISSNIIKPLSFPTIDSYDTTEGLSEDWSSLASLAKANNWLFVDFIPLSVAGDQEAEEVSASFVDNLCSCHSLATALRDSAHISDEKYDQTIASLGLSQELETKEVQLSKYDAVFLCTGVASSLAFSNILETLCGIMTVHIRQEEANQIHKELNKLANQEESAVHLQLLRDRIRNKLETGIYKIPPLINNENIRASTPLVSCLQELLLVQPNTVDFILVDDRFLQSFDTFGEETPIISSCDLIDSLKRRSILNMDTAAGYRQKLRVSEIQFVRLYKGDLYYFLRKAVTQNGFFSENANLVILRRYYASCLNNSKNLRHVKGTNEDILRKSEILFVSHLIYASSDAFIEIWSDESTSDIIKAAMSDWVLTSIWISFPILHKLLPQLDTEHIDLKGMSESQLALVGIQLGDELKTKKFYGWLFSRLATDKRQLISFVPYLKKTILSLSEHSKNEGERQLANSISLQIFERLPETVRDVLDLNKEELESCGVKYVSPVCIGDLRFDNSSFWNSVELAYTTGKEQSVKNLSDSDQNIQIISVDKPNSPLHLKFSVSNDNDFNLVGPELALVKERSTLNKTEISGIVRSLDLKKKEIDLYFDSLYTVNSTAVDRINSFREKHIALPTEQINRLKSLLRNEQSFSIKDVEPLPFERILSFARLSNPISQADIDSSAKELIDDLGLLETLKRHSILPINPSGIISNEFYKLDRNNQDRLLESLGHIERHPTRLAYIVLLLSEGDETNHQKAIDLLLESLKNKIFEYHKLFEAILRWSQSKILENHDPYGTDSDSVLFASWIQTSRIHEVMIETDSPLELVKFFNHNESKCLDVALRFSPKVELAMLNSQHFSPIVFLASQTLNFLNLESTVESNKNVLISPLQNLIFPHELDNVPAIELLMKRTSFTSYFPRDLYTIPEGSVREFPELPDDSFLENAQIDSRISHLISLIREGDNTIKSWTLLNLHLRTFPVSEEEKNDLKEVISQFEPNDFEDHVPEFLSSMFFQFYQCKYISNLAYDFLFQRLCVFDIGLRKLTPKLSIRERADHLIGGAFLLANRTDDLLSNVELLSSLILGLSNMDNKLSSYLLTNIASLNLRLPIKAQKILTPALINLRENTKRIEYQLVNVNNKPKEK